MNIGWQILDKEGVIHSGTSEEMDSAWDAMICSTLSEYLLMMGEMDIELIHPDNLQSLIDTYEKWHCKYQGDLVLVEVHKIFK